MNFAYGWAFSHPVRKVYCNITVTALSAAIALIVGSIELLGLLADQLHWKGSFWNWLGAIDLNTVGLVIVGLFIATWIVALPVWRLARIDQRWILSREGT
jgi:high-affinity nickel-transport protein